MQKGIARSFIIAAALLAPSSLWTSIALARSTHVRAGGEIIVAVIDTGIDLNHPTFKKSIWQHPANQGITLPEYGWDFVNNQANPEDKNGHGTHISGIINSFIARPGNRSGASESTQRRIRIMPLKYYSATHSGATNLALSIKAIYYAIDHGARIINYSGGGPGFSEAEFKAIQKAQSRGILFISAAGNDHQDIDTFENAYYPSSYRSQGLRNILSVAAINSKGHLLKSSNWGVKSIDIAAPGEKIYSALPKGQFGYMTGTSQATAYVTGVSALLLARNPKLTPEHLREILLLSVDPLPFLKGKIMSAGSINFRRALSHLNQERRL